MNYNSLLFTQVWTVHSTQPNNITTDRLHLLAFGTFYYWTKPNFQKYQVVRTSVIRTTLPHYYFETSLVYLNQELSIDMLSSTERQPETEPNVTADSMANHRAQRDMLSWLPSELLELILEYISDKKDAASVRMVSRSFSQLAGATRQLFQSIGVHPTNQSVSRLESISRHQSIRLHVQRIVFFPPLGDPEGLSESLAEEFGLCSTWLPLEYK